MKELMNIIYSEVSKVLPIFYEELPREQDGSVKIENPISVYNIEGVYFNTDNEARREIPLTIDIWFRTEDLFKVEDIVEEIDKKITNSIFKAEEKIMKVRRDSVFCMNIDDSEMNLRRKRLSFLVDYYK